MVLESLGFNQQLYNKVHSYQISYEILFKSCLTSTLYCVFLHKGMTSNMRCLCCVRTMLYIGLLLLAMELTFTDTNMPRILQISADTNIANKFVTFIILFSITGGLHHEGD